MLKYNLNIINTFVKNNLKHLFKNLIKNDLSIIFVKYLGIIENT